MGVFTVTERGVFSRCRRQAVLTSKNGRHLGRLFPPLNLSVGTIVHRAHQLWLENPHKTMYACAMDASIEASKGVRERYLKQVGTYPSDDEMATTHESIDLALTMCENYALKYGTPLPPDYILIKAEQKIRVPVNGTERTCATCAGQGWVSNTINYPKLVPVGYTYPQAQQCPDCEPGHVGRQIHYLEGKVDGLIQHSSGRIDVLEHKTYGNRPKQEDLQSNDQFIAYLWLVGQLGFNPHLDSCVAYDGMWRRKAVPRGRTFDDLFARYTLTRSPAELEEFARFLPLELNDMAAQYARPDDAYINRPWDKPSCWDCAFGDDVKNGRIGLCRAMSRGETDHVALMLQTQFTERTDDTEAEVEEEIA
jgi:hypothetical protein